MRAWAGPVADVLTPISDGLILPRLGPLPEEIPTLGWGVVDWVEEYLCHGPGDVMGELLELDDEFTNFLLWAYSLFPREHPRAGRRRYRKALLSRPKGRAKSELAGEVASAEFLGPVRFDGWNAQGEPVGRPVRSPFIRCLATEETQAGNTYENVRVMLEHARDNFPELFGHVDPGLSRTLLGGGGEIRPSSASSAAKDGGKETFVVPDETHLYITPELRRMYRTVSRNLAKRKAAEPWMLETSTMYALGQDSVAEGTYKTAARVATGALRDQSLLVDHREASADLDWDDDEQVMAGLVDVYGDFAPNMDLEEVLRQIRDPEADRVEVVRYFGNRASPLSGAAFDVKRWAELYRPVRVPRRTWITLGFDGARFRDTTALVACGISSGHVWPLGVWERPADAPEDWSVPTAEVNAAVDDAFSEFRVWRLYADPPYWEDQVDTWAGKYGEKRVTRWWTHRQRPMAFALRAFQSAMIGGDISHDGSPLLAAHIAHARKRTTQMRDDDGKSLWTIAKESPDSPLKIDAAMAAVLAVEARGDAIAAGMLKKMASKAVGF